ncbi:hypothetical protein [Alteromonas australica]|uniref:hypothetical protein n=1 Tax=Alteromonas australica TaxID=589873 RepID=UPI0023537E69|nr:hypothetical protein [Alteromonas australica]|tara:strand:+ start:315 stop:1628 length:1314 start_codon:yes stop_codon:yes gene_type:complete
MDDKTPLKIWLVTQVADIKKIVLSHYKSLLVISICSSIYLFIHPFWGKANVLLSYLISVNEEEALSSLRAVTSTEQEQNKIQPQEQYFGEEGDLRRISFFDISNQINNSENLPNPKVVASFSNFGENYKNNYVVVDFTYFIIFYRINESDVTILDIRETPSSDIAVLNYAFIEDVDSDGFIEAYLSISSGFRGWTQEDLYVFSFLDGKYNLKKLATYYWELDFESVSILKHFSENQLDLINNWGENFKVHDYDSFSLLDTISAQDLLKVDDTKFDEFISVFREKNAYEYLEIKRSEFREELDRNSGNISPIELTNEQLKKMSSHNGRLYPEQTCNEKYKAFSYRYRGNLYSIITIKGKPFIVSTHDRLRRGSIEVLASEDINEEPILYVVYHPDLVYEESKIYIFFDLKNAPKFITTYGKFGYGTEQNRFFNKICAK